MLELKEEMKNMVDMQIIAFPQEGMYAYKGGDELVEEALKMGADVVGCNSYAAANQGRCCGHCQNADQELLFDAPHDRLPP